MATLVRPQSVRHGLLVAWQSMQFQHRHQRSVLSAQQWASILVAVMNAVNNILQDILRPGDLQSVQPWSTALSLLFGTAPWLPRQI